MVEAKPKGLGGLSPEKKALLKKLIMDLAVAELKREEEEKARQKQEYLDSKVGSCKCDNMGEDELRRYCNQLQEKIEQAEEDRYDWEFKLRKQDYEINQLTISVNDIRGTFIKPVLRKVATSADTTLHKLNEYLKSKREQEH